MPSGVGTTLRVVRCKSLVPSRTSNSDTEVETEDRGMRIVCAAFVKLEVSTTRIKIRNESIRSTTPPLFGYPDMYCHVARIDRNLKGRRVTNWRAWRLIYQEAGYGRAFNQR